MNDGGELVKVSDRAEAFLASLEQGDENELLRGVGIPGPYRKKHYRRGLREGLMITHWSGKGIVWAYPAALEKFERVINYEDRAPANPAITKQLLAAFRQMQIGSGPKKEVLALPAHEPAAEPAIKWDL